MPDSRAGGGRGGRAARSGSGQPTNAGVGGIVGAGPSMVGVVGAMRARDVSRPTDDDLERAERTVVVRRRSVDVATSPSARRSSPATPVPTPPAGNEPVTPIAGDEPSDPLPSQSSAGDSAPSDS
jgi:hypothetical protein